MSFKLEKKPPPYIGVTGFTHRNQIIAAIKTIPRRAQYRLMAGILVSSKTMDGQTNRFPARYPHWEDIPGIPVSDPRVLNLAHFATKRPERLAEDMDVIMNHAANLDGIQLNMAWPDPKQLAEFRIVHDDAVIVLQIGAKAFAEVGEKNHQRLAAWLYYTYGSVINYALLDPSGGLGLSLSANLMGEQLLAIEQHNPVFGMGIAGGLKAVALPGIKGLCKEFPNISIDAEGGLRTKDSRDLLDKDQVYGYLMQAYDMLDGL